MPLGSLYYWEIIHMKWTGLNEIRESYLNFFESKAHLRAKSYPLVPRNDNSLLLIGAGMAPLKPYFTGQEVPPRKRMTTCQKCIRTGDIENVGVTARHGTFFEMLGNFSFGDYFKEDAISWAWEYVTKVLEIPEDRLFVTVYEDDAEAADIWHNKVGLSKEKIFYMGKEDNFWEAGIDGPCGPCSEIYFDRGPEFGCGKPDCTVGCDCDRYMEFWNIVFTQFERHEDGTYTPLAQRNIDTGMGLERIASIMQNVGSIFDVDTIKAIRDHVCTLAGAEYGKDPKKDISIRVITDHIRSVTFMASDGVLPSNEGRGYVMRRLLRRAVRHAKLLGIDGLFLKELVGTVVENSKHEYTELEEKYDYIVSLLTVEEKKFNSTIDKGMAILGKYIDTLKSSGKTVLDGEACFMLSDTHGFPFDLTREIVEEAGMTCDEEGYRAAMEKQRETARGAHAGTKYMGADETVFHRLDKEFNSEFVGYNCLKTDSTIDFITNEEEEIDVAGVGDEIYIVSSKTPFYAESGGQIGDVGTISTPSGKCVVIDTQKVVAGKIAHKAKVVEGGISKGQTAVFAVSESRRGAIMRNHSAAHLLQAALREVLGEHVHQAGSYVDAERLRFDFSHFNPVSLEEIAKIEKLVNEKIFSALTIKMEEMPIEEAKKLGAMALFGEKYGSVVRVVTMGDYSTEFCGGTHLDNTSKIGVFKIISENSVAAGVRRIEAVTGTGVLALVDTYRDTLNQIAVALKAPSVTDLVTRCVAAAAEMKALEKQNAALNAKLASSKLDEVKSSAVEVGGFLVMCAKVDGATPEILRAMCDELKESFRNVVVVLATDSNIMCAAGKDAVNAGAHSGKVVQQLAALTGGKGGGRPDSAMAGVGDTSKLMSALSQTAVIVSSFVK